MKRKLLYNICIEAFFVQQLLKNSKAHKKIDSFLCSRRSDFWEGSYEKEMEIVAEAGDRQSSCGCYGGRGPGMPAYGYIKPKSGRQTVAGNNGTGIQETEDWIETFPNGVFAFKDNAVYLKEGEKKEKKLTVYRLGGRDGEATAHIALTPAAAEMEEDGGELNTANAVSLERCEA